MPVTYDFSGRVAVVTGGANGIGREVARRLSHANCRVAVWDLVAPDLPDVTGYRVDVTRPETISTALDPRRRPLDVQDPKMTVTYTLPYQI